jgi:hypothetical protein
MITPRDGAAGAKRGRVMNRIEEVNVKMGGGEAAWSVADLVVSGEVTIRDAAAWVIDEALLALRSEIHVQHPAVPGSEGWSLDLSERIADAVLSFVDDNGVLVDEAVW